MATSDSLIASSSSAGGMPATIGLSDSSSPGGAMVIYETDGPTGQSPTARFRQLQQERAQQRSGLGPAPTEPFHSHNPQVGTGSASSGINGPQASQFAEAGAAPGADLPMVESLLNLPSGPVEADLAGMLEQEFGPLGENTQNTSEQRRSADRRARDRNGIGPTSRRIRSSGPERGAREWWDFLGARTRCFSSHF